MLLFYNLLQNYYYLIKIIRNNKNLGNITDYSISEDKHMLLKNYRVLLLK